MRACLPQLFLFLSLFSSVCFAEQKLVKGDYQIHYSVFPSTAITPDIASKYNLKRSQYRAIINITPQIQQDESIEGVKVKISGKARNLIGNTVTLNFTEIVEGKVVYYLAELPFSNEEHFRFSLELTPLTGSGEVIPITFEKKFFR